MTDQTAAPANLGRGLAFAALAIPAAILAFAVIASLFGIITGLIALAVPYLSVWLYGKGAGAPLERAAWLPWGAVTAVAVILGIISSFVAGIYAAFTAVGGDGGPLGPVFLSTLSRQLGASVGDNMLPVLLGVGLGAVGITGVIKQSRARAAQPADVAAPLTPPVQAPPAPPAPNQPSPGVMLNGQPLDPDGK